ncbi:MAG: Lytic transglycosylase catalytic [Petrotoga mobilis]|nr:MAG: Lytic transglycosylase catalytic [Petrotoga mobilis]
MKPNTYFEFNSNSTGEFGVEFYSINKYAIMDSNKLLESVWSQPRTLIGGQMMVESSNYTHAISSSKAMGLLQLKNLTGLDLHVYNLFDPYDNLKGALEYHGYLRRLFNDERLQIIAYHDGPTAVMAGKVSTAGEAYYEKVKRAQQNYSNTKIYSPYFVGGRLSYYSEDEEDKISTKFNAGFAYRKFEVYGNVGLEFPLKRIEEFDFIDIQTDYGYTFLYVPRTNIGIGVEGKTVPEDLILRIGLPWQNFILKGPKNPELIYKHELTNNWTSKILINTDNLLLSSYFSIYNLDLFVGYEVYESSINLGFRLAF